MQSNLFDTILLLARPAAGKSEIIHYLKNTPLNQRKERFHIGEMLEIDDFPMLWAWFEEDDILTSMGQPRLHSTPDGYFLHNHLWNVLIRRICLEYTKQRRDTAAHPKLTTLIEFARGTEHGGFGAAFEHLSREVARQAAILYVNVSYEESLRKNRRRFNPQKPDSILEHGLPDKKMERLYCFSDWEELSRGAPQGWLSIQGCQVPFVVFENEDDVTTPGGRPLGERLEQTLASLWDLAGSRSGSSPA